MARHDVMVSLGIALAFGCGAGAGPIEGRLAARDAAPAPRVVSLSPSGADDTARLQAALDAASASDRPMVIELGAGTFVAGPLHAKNFRGALRGAGKTLTLLTNPAAPVQVATDFQPAEPSATNVWPGALVFVGGDFTVSDLTVHVRGAAPTTGWNVFGMTLTPYAFGIDVEGNGGPARAAFERVAVIGEPVPANPSGILSNVVNGIMFEGLIGFPARPPEPTSGTFSVQDCEIRGAASGAPTYNLRDARVRIVGSTFDTSVDATEIGDSTGLDFLFADNRVTAAVSALTPFDLCLGAPAGCGLTGSRIQFAGNRVSAPVGFVVDNRPFADVACRLVGNDVTYETFAVVLGPDTSGCLVAGPGAVQDLGTGNRVVGQR